MLGHTDPSIWVAIVNKEGSSSSCYSPSLDVSGPSVQLQEIAQLSIKQGKENGRILAISWKYYKSLKLHVIFLYLFLCYFYQPH